jgi:hypothetical protein
MKIRLRSAVGERGRGAEGGEERLANRSRSVTAVAEPQTEARRFCGIVTFPLVTSARFAKWNRRGREGKRADRQPVERSKPRVGHGVILMFSNQNKLFSAHWLHTICFFS